MFKIFSECPLNFSSFESPGEEKVNNNDTNTYQVTLSQELQFLEVSTNLYQFYNSELKSMPIYMVFLKTPFYKTTCYQIFLKCKPEMQF